MGFHGRAAACKPHINMLNAKLQLELCKACQQYQHGKHGICLENATYQNAQRSGLTSLMWRNLTGLHGVLTSTLF